MDLNLWKANEERQDVMLSKEERKQLVEEKYDALMVG